LRIPWSNALRHPIFMDFIYSRCARQYKKARGAEGSPGYVETKKFL